MRKLSTITSFVGLLGIACATTQTPSVEMTGTALETLVDSTFATPEPMLLQLQSENPRADYPFPDYVTLRKGPGIRVGDRIFRLLPLSQLDDKRLSIEQPGIETTKRYDEYINDGWRLKGVQPNSTALTLPPSAVPPPAAPAVRNQGSRLTCVTFASLAAMEYRSDVPDDLSEEYAHHTFMLNTLRDCCADPGLPIFDAAASLTNHGIPEEQLWPYRDDAPNCESAASCLDPPHPNAFPSTTERYRIVKTNLLTRVSSTPANIRNPAYLEALLATGYHIAFVTGVAWGAENANGILDVTIDNTTNKPFRPWGLHAMVLVGYDSVNRYFIARNSWGPNWGSHGGYAWLSYRYMEVYPVAGFVIDAVVRDTSQHP